ncbi:hypothetical protein EYF80_038250 [Liparis tanakae]|uniref:Uncharacterized protein n=1 Tax=Liparis tanakae TaxID=230148 RepID=A0A4Z2GEC8_9TELE|nr:hypothetical protein EYF80_038250 [Liparis tanakae]
MQRERSGTYQTGNADRNWPGALCHGSADGFPQHCVFLAASREIKAKRSIKTSTAIHPVVGRCTTDIPTSSLLPPVTDTTQDMSCQLHLGKIPLPNGLEEAIIANMGQLLCGAAADVSLGQRSHDPLLLSTTPSQRIKPWSGYPGSSAPVSSEKRYTLQALSVQLQQAPTGDGCHIAMLPSVAIEK